MTAVAGEIHGAERQPVSHPPETVLTVDQLADWLQVSVGTVQKLPIRCFYVRNRQRYLAQHVLEWMEGEAKS